jgi:hypothetical protein
VPGPDWSAARTLKAPVVLLSALAWTAAGCEPNITSVGAWEPVVQQPIGGQAGSAGAVAVAGSVGSAGEPGGAGGDAPGLYLEAEDGALSFGFSIVVDVAASNGQYIQPPTGPASDTTPMAETPRARYTFELANAGDYVIWGRIYSPDVSSNRFWFQVDGGAWHIWRITVGEIWFWDDFHDDTDYDDTLHFNLAAGSHELTIAKDASTARLDRLYITAAGDEPPGNDTPCNPPHTIDRGGGVCARSCGSLAPPGMHTSCLADVCAGQETFEVYDCNVCCIVP